MSIDYSVNSLLKSVKQRSMNADNQNLLQDNDIIRGYTYQMSNSIFKNLLPESLK